MGSILSQEGGVETNVSRDKSLPNTTHEQISVLDKTLAPNVHEGLKSTTHTSQGCIIDPRSPKDDEEGNRTSKGRKLDRTCQTDSRFSNNGLSAKHPTLLHFLSPDEGLLGHEETWNGISVHGPSQQGPRTMLVILQEPWNPG